MDKVLFSGKIGDASYSIELKDGHAIVMLDYNGLDGLDHLKALIPGGVDDMAIEFIKNYLKG